jgi:AraC-like DNA-binding protein
MTIAPPETVVASLQWEMATLRHAPVAAGETLAASPPSLWLMVLEGAADLETAAGVQRLQAGDAALVGAAIARRVSAVVESVLAVADLRLVVPGPLPSPFVVLGFRQRHPAVAALVGMCPLRGDCDRAAFAAGYGTLIGAAMGIEVEDRQDRADPAVAEVMAAIGSRPGEPWTLERMARVAHLSRSALVEHFRSEVGRSPVQMLREMRMLAARQLLGEPERPVTQVAFAVGYHSTAAFSRAFSAHHGVGPQAWRAGRRAQAPR